MAKDMMLHFAAGAATAIIVALMLGEIAGLIAGAIAGVAKEVKDEHDYGGADWYDLAATLGGAVVGITAVGLIW